MWVKLWHISDIDLSANFFIQSLLPSSTSFQSCFVSARHGRQVVRRHRRYTGQLSGSAHPTPLHSSLGAAEERVGKLEDESKTVHVNFESWLDKLAANCEGRPCCSCYQHTQRGHNAPYLRTDFSLIVLMKILLYQCWISIHVLWRMFTFYAPGGLNETDVSESQTSIYH